MARQAEAQAVLTTNADVVTQPRSHGSQDRSPNGYVGLDPRPRASDWDLNDEGRATAMTLLTELQGWGAPWLRLVLWGFRHLEPLLIKLRRLSFIHFAHWSVLDGLAADEATGGSARKDKYLLFESNFNGPWHEYIEVFCQVVGGGIRPILASAKGFPGLAPVRGFRAFMEHHELVADHYYSAYPDHSATMIRAALELDGDLTKLRTLANQHDDTGFAEAWDQMLAHPRVQANLAGQASTLPGMWAYLRQLACGRKNVAGKTYVFSALTPIAPGRADELRTHLRRLPRCCKSPLAKVPGTHFGRWVVLDRVFHDSWPEQFEVLDPAYLLFTAVFDLTPPDTVRAYLDRLVSVLDTEDDVIWDWPAGSGQQGRTDYLLGHQHDVNFLFAAYPGSVDQVKRALTNRERLVGFAQQAQTLKPDLLRAAFVTAFDDAGRPAHCGDQR